MIVPYFVLASVFFVLGSGCCPVVPMALLVIVVGDVLYLIYRVVGHCFSSRAGIIDIVCVIGLRLCVRLNSTVASWLLIIYASSDILADQDWCDGACD